VSVFEETHEIWAQRDGVVEEVRSSDIEGKKRGDS
jgi:hypothetical protein